MVMLSHRRRAFRDGGDDGWTILSAPENFSDLAYWDLNANSTRNGVPSISISSGSRNCYFQQAWPTGITEIEVALSTYFYWQTSTDCYASFTPTDLGGYRIQYVKGEGADTVVQPANTGGVSVTYGRSHFDGDLDFIIRWKQSGSDVIQTIEDSAGIVATYTNAGQSISSVTGMMARVAANKTTHIYNLTMRVR